MPGFSSFTFGIRNYFTFTFSFQTGRPPHDPTAVIPQTLVETTKDKPKKITTEPNGKIANEPSRGTITNQLRRQVAVNPAQESAAKSIPDEQESPIVDENRCLLLDTIPLEIRCIIYELLLVSVDPIDSEQANKLLGEDRTILLTHHNPIPHISATFLRTCRKIYEEALPILYGWNVFDFTNPKAVRDFKNNGIESYYQVWRLRKLKIQGRLTLLNSVNLKFIPDSSSVEHYSRFDATPGKRDTLRAWTKDFFNNQLYDLKFPALQNLTLDFQAMKFDEKAGFRVDPFVRRLAPYGGLRKLVVLGLKHEDTLKELRTGLVKDDGIFVVENPLV